jgi:hypothetical protein
MATTAAAAAAGDLMGSWLCGQLNSCM